MKSEAQIDNEWLRKFTYAMKKKLAQKRSEGYGGWHDVQQCPIERLFRLLEEHFEEAIKDPIDCANFLMMIWAREEMYQTWAKERELKIINKWRTVHGRKPLKRWNKSCGEIRIRSLSHD